MKRKMIVPALLAVMMLGLGSCMSVAPYLPSSATIPASGKYTIHGRVTVTSADIKGLGSNGHYEALLAKAKKQYGADDVVNILVDLKTSNWFFAKSSKFVMTGIAISYK